MTKPKRQHYVPESYLNEFAYHILKKPYVWVFSKDGKKKRKQNPDKVFKMKDLYTIKVHGKEKDYSIETSLGDIETKYIEIFRNKIKKMIPLSEYEYLQICIFVSAMFQRTLRYKDNMEGFLDEIISRYEWMENQHNLKDKESERLKEYKKDAHKLSLIKLIPEIAQVLFKMNLAILYIPKTSMRHFITSDDPVVLFNPELQWQRFYSAGIGQKATEIHFPLSTKFMLFLSWSNVRGYLKINNREIDDLNRHTRHACYKEFVSNSFKIKKIWFSKYPASLPFILKILKRKIFDRIFIK